MSLNQNKAFYKYPVATAIRDDAMVIAHDPVLGDVNIRKDAFLTGASIPVPQSGFATVALMNAAVASYNNGDCVLVTNDPAPGNNGAWSKQSGAFVQSSFDRVANLEKTAKPGAVLKNLFPGGNLPGGANAALNPSFASYTTIVSTSDAVFTGRGIGYVAQCSNILDNAFDTFLSGAAHAGDYFYAECIVYAPGGTEWPDSNLLVVETRDASNNVVAGTTVTKSYATIDANHRRYYTTGQLSTTNTFTRVTMRTKGTTSGNNQVSGYVLCTSRLAIDPVTNGVPLNDWGTYKESGESLRADVDSHSASIATNTANITTISTSLGIAAPNYFVDAARPDDTGNGLSLATAKKTIQAAINTAPAGSAIAVAAGTYVENDASTHGINIGKNLTLVATGAAIIRATGGAARVVYVSGAANVTFSGPFTIDAQGTIPLYLPSGAQTGTVIFSGCSFMGFPSGSPGMSPYSPLNLVGCNISSSVSTGAVVGAYGTAPVTLTNCIASLQGSELVLTQGTATITMTGCIVTVNGAPDGIISKRTNSAVAITGKNTFTFARAATQTTIINITSASSAGAVTFTDNTVTLLGTMRSNILALQYCGTADIERNTFNLPGSLTGGFAVIKSVDLSPTIWDNTITIAGASPCSPIYVTSAGAAVVADIRRNTIKTPALSAYAIIVGADGDPGVGLRNKCDGSIIEGNFVYGPNWFGTVAVPANNLLHSIILGWSKGAVRYNYVNGGGYGVVMKANAMDFTGGEGVHDNVFINCSYAAVRIKGVNNLPVYNNTLALDNTKPASNLLSVSYNQDTGAQAATGGQGLLFKNNLVIGPPGIALVQFDNNSASGEVMDYNDYFMTDGSAVSFQIGASNYASFALFQAGGFEAHGKNVDPVAVAGIYELSSTSPLRGAGVNLGLAVDYWGRTRTNPPDIGAIQYV